MDQKILRTMSKNSNDKISTLIEAIKELTNEISNINISNTQSLSSSQSPQSLHSLQSLQLSQSSQSSQLPQLSQSASASSSVKDLFSRNLFPGSQATWRYIQLDSTYRNRTLYPNQSDFVVPFTNAAPGINAFDSIEPISKSLPFASGIVQSVLYDSPTGGAIVLQPPTYEIDNYYINDYISVDYKTSQITQFDITTNTAYYNSQLNPTTTIPYYISTSPPSFIAAYNLLSPTQVLLIPTFGPIPTSDGVIVGSYMYFAEVSISPNLITAYTYNAITGEGTATVLTPINTHPTSPFVRICSFSYDNVQPLRYNGTHVSQPICYAIQLLAISIPNQLLSSGYGTAQNYPFLIVYIGNEPTENNQTIYTNSPVFPSATYRLYVNAPTNTSQSFAVFTNQSATSIQSVTILINKPWRLTITDSYGNILSFIKQDNKPPLPPDPLLQITCTLAISRL